MRPVVLLAVAWVAGLVFLVAGLERPAPLFDAFVGAALQHSVGEQPAAAEPSVSRTASS